jgi:CRP-like cAMP-binding protein
MAEVESLLALRSNCAYCAARPLGLCSALDASEAFSELRNARRAVRFIDAGSPVYRQGDPCGDALNLVSGWLVQHQDLEDGRRQVLRILLPGAIVGHQAAGLTAMTHGTTALTPASLCVLPAARLTELRQRHPGLNERYLWMLERDSQLAVDHLISIGQRDARERVAALLLELAIRSTGRADFEPGETLAIPLTQVLIGEATGLTAIHVNRMIRRLREDRVLDFHERKLTIIDPERLFAIANLSDAVIQLWTRPQAGDGDLRGAGGRAAQPG